MTATGDAARGPSPLYRLRRYVAKYGGRAAVTRAFEAARMRLMLDETHIWYEVPLDDTLLPGGLDPDLVLRRATEDELPLIERLPSVSLAEARRRFAGGAEPWFVLEDGDPRFACWIFRGQMPMLSAPGGVLKLPPWAACVEDSVTAPGGRGRGVAPAAVRTVAAELRAQGLRSLLTKVDESNTPSRKAVAKIGFREIGKMRYRRLGPWHRTTMPEAEGEAGTWLQSILS